MKKAINVLDPHNLNVNLIKTEIFTITNEPNYKFNRETNEVGWRIGVLKRK